MTAIKWKAVVVYLNHIVSPLEKVEEHQERIQLVSAVLEKYGVVDKLKICALYIVTTNYSGK